MRAPTMDPKERSLRVLMLPWLAHGHVSPFLELAKRLSQYNVIVHLCSTPVNLTHIKGQLKDGAYPSIHLLELHLPTIPGLPPEFHSTKYAPDHLLFALKNALDLSEPSFQLLLQSSSPDLVIYDFFPPWVPAAAQRLNIPAVQLLVGGGAVFPAFFYHSIEHPTQQFPFPAIHFSSKDNFKAMPNDAGPFLESMKRSSSIILVKSFREIESKYINYLSYLTKKEIIPVGHLVADSGDVDDECNKFREWLSRKERGSVVFVCLGSEHFMSEEQIVEMAHGLELSEVSFIWAFKVQKGEGESADSWARLLPSGFLERIEGRGMVVEGWAPQRTILAHPSVDGFLTHCGWNSVLEGMWFGVPLIALPLQHDQPVNAKLVVELGVGLEIKKESDGFMSFKRGEVAKGIRNVVVSEEGEGVRRKAKEMARKMGSVGDEEIQILVQKLEAICGIAKNPLKINESLRMEILAADVA